MTKEKELLLFKLLALGAVLLYAYKTAKAQGGNLQGNPFVAKLDPEKIARIGAQLAPEPYRESAHKIGTAFLGRVLS
jgi:hypothetical protein